ncbi:hypothetical protein C8J56DRAFT_968232 [Mycena floridula]|nr:hypothetical protein C8J56DRAFT_968232 [Mycena floridula]
MSFLLCRPVGLGLAQRCFKPAVYLVHARTVASVVSSIPASQSFKHAALNVKEETGNAASDVAKMISAARPATSTSFVGITRSMASEVPRSVLAFGLMGGIPYLGAGATTVYLARQASMAASGVSIHMDPGVALTLLDQALNIQVTYGAVMLSFLGAMHWGMEFAGYGGQQGYRRLMLGAAPVLFAWPTLVLQPMTALMVQWVGFTSLWYVDWKATSAGWTPRWYSQYRFYLSILVGTCILGSLAGTSYYGPLAGHGFISRDVDEIREERKLYSSAHGHTITVPIEAIPGSERFVVIRKRAESNEQPKTTGS